ncbi:hypothetical protein PC115_g14757 [Phytophthora cactorum]|uniref:Uncharacterized protein n=1 Tax=Phytophthora cactorum TaxID=29920 RepID=A0A8T1BML1_9STRA|nr:hypothetical protein PC115_g14757 [Phytophthora cactorum]
MIRILQQLVPGLDTLASLAAVEKATAHLNLMEEWTRESFIFCKEEWLTEECRGVFKNAEAKLTALLQSAIQYRHVQKKKDTKTLLISAWQLNLSEEDIADIENFVTLMHSQNDDKLPTVVLVGFATLRLEHPLQLWSNVVIMSPDVHVSAIDLSAVGQAPGPVLSQVKTVSMELLDDVVET